MQLTQNELNANLLNLRTKHLRLELLDFDMKTIDTIESECIGGSVTFNANDDIRRSGNIEIAIPIDRSAKNFLDTLDGYSIELGGKIWLDKYVKVFIGIEDYSQKPMQIVWYNKGVYLIDQPQRIFNSTQFSISFNIIDLMAKLTGVRQGQLSGQGIIFETQQINTTQSPPVNERTRMVDLLTSVIEEFGGFTKHSIYPIPQKFEFLPYEIKLGISSTVYDILKQFMEILSNWQIYFDNDGTLIVEPIPDGVNAPIFPIEPTHLINNNLSVDFQNVKNQVILYGKLNNSSYYTENTTTATNLVEYVGDTLVLRYSALSKANFSILGTNFNFRSLNQYNSVPLTKIKIYNNAELFIESDLVVFEGYNPTTQTKTFMNVNDVLPNTSYIVRILNATLLDSKEIDFTKPIIMEFYSKQQVSWCLVNDNKESPFYINNNIKGENYYCGTAFTSPNFNVGENYLLTLNNEEILSELNDGTIVTFMANTTNIFKSGADSTSVSIQTTEGTLLVDSKPIVENRWTLNPTTQIYYRKPVIENKILNNYTIYQLQYDKTRQEFVFSGRYPYAITSVLTGGNYDVIFADRLAEERCIWELYLRSSLNNKINIGIIPNYAIDVNYKIEYDENWAKPLDVYDWEQYEVQAPPPNVDKNSQNYVVNLNNNNTQNYFVKKDKEINYFLTKTISFPLGLTNTPQDIEAIQIYRDKNLVGSDYEN